MKQKHIHCPVEGWDCPYCKVAEDGNSCICTLENPLDDCDDYAALWTGEEDE